jgi:hypothetical protein
VEVERGGGSGEGGAGSRWEGGVRVVESQEWGVRSAWFGRAVAAIGVEGAAAALGVVRAERAGKGKVNGNHGEREGAYGQRGAGQGEVWGPVLRVGTVGTKAVSGERWARRRRARREVGAGKCRSGGGGRC